MHLHTARIALFCTLIPFVAGAADLEGRVTRLENILANQRSSDILLQNQRLQQEVQQLRGLIEQQQHQIDSLAREQRDQYMDLDSRLGRQAGGGTPVADPSRTPTSAGRRSDQMLTPARRSGAVVDTGQGQISRAPDLTLPKAGGTRGMSEKEGYRNAFNLLKQRRYDEAVRAFEGLLASYPNGEFSDNARYWLGETNYVKLDYRAALKDFQRLVQDYPLSPKVPGAMLKIGYIQDEQNNPGRARETLRTLTEKFPKTTEARLARGRLDRMARRGR